MHYETMKAKTNKNIPDKSTTKSHNKTEKTYFICGGKGRGEIARD